MSISIIRSRCSRRRVWRISESIAALFLAIVAAAFGLAKPSNAQAPWRNVHISAGSGFVTDIIAQPKVPNLFYLRTDVGGFFRWDPRTKGWIPISDFIPIEHRDLYGGESIAVDTNNANAVYIACGGGQDGMIFKSINRGNTWTQLGLKGVRMSGNSSMRWGGERLAVQPGNSRVLMFGSRSQGLWRSSDAGANWRRTTLPFPEGNHDGVQAVAFDPNSPSTVYAAVAKNGIFRSTDSGTNWTNISHGIIKPERITVAPDSTLWLTYNNGVAKYAHGAWTNVTPKGAAADAYCGLAIDPRNAKHVVVSYGLWGDAAPNAMFMTGNGGATWTRLKETVTTDVPWYVKLAPGKKAGTIKPFCYTPIANFMFDPHNPSSVWFVSAGGIYNTPNINRRGGPLFQHVENGHEELCVCTVCTPPSGHELLTGTGDVNGFVFDKGLNTYPSSSFKMAGSYTGVTCNLAYEERDPKNMVALWVPQSPWSFPTTVLTSHDGGLNWTQDKTFPTAPAGKKPLTPIGVAESSSNPGNIIVVVRDTNVDKDVWFYKTGANTGWKQCAGLADQSYDQISAIPIVADPVVGRTFYIYCAGKIFRSTDGGATYRQMSTGTVGSPDVAEFFKLAAQPGKSGDLWLSEDGDNANHLNPNRPSWEGLYHSTDAGRSWTKLPGVTRTVVFSFGKASSSGHSTLYYYGRKAGDNTDCVFRSTDLGKTWKIISHRGQAMGDGPWTMEASRQTYGRVFIGTSGRGIFYSSAGGTNK